MCVCTRLLAYTCVTIAWQGFVGSRTYRIFLAKILTQLWGLFEKRGLHLGA